MYCELKLDYFQHYFQHEYNIEIELTAVISLCLLQNIIVTRDVVDPNVNYVAKYSNIKTLK